MYTRKNWKRRQIKLLYVNAHSSIIHYIQKVETTHLSIKGWVDKQIVVYTHIGICIFAMIEILVIYAHGSCPSILSVVREWLDRDFLKGLEPKRKGKQYCLVFADWLLIRDTPPMLSQAASNSALAFTSCFWGAQRSATCASLASCQTFWACVLPCAHALHSGIYAIP